MLCSCFVSLLLSCGASCAVGLVDVAVFFSGYISSVPFLWLVNTATEMYDSIYNDFQRHLLLNKLRARRDFYTVEMDAGERMLIELDVNREKSTLGNFISCHYTKQCSDTTNVNRKTCANKSTRNAN